MGGAPAAAPLRPPVTEPGDWRVAAPRRWRLDNGVRVEAFHLPGQHVLAARMAVPAPLSAEPTSVEGVALLGARCLDEGTDRHTAEQLAEELERQGIAFGAGVTPLGLLVDLDMTADHLEPALGLAVECLSGATFPEKEVARQVRHRLADIAQERSDPGSRAALEFLRTYYHPGDRASRPTGGGYQSVRAVTADAVRSHHRAVVRPDDAVLVLAGDLSGVDAEAVVGRTLGRWTQPGQRRDLPAAGELPRRASDAGRIVFVERPGAVQTELYVGSPGPSRRDPYGWGTYSALAMVIGGSPQSRIDRVLREEKGYTYGVHCAFQPRSRSGTFVVSGSVRGDATAAALDDLLSVLDTPGAGLHDDELRAAGSYIARTAPGRYATADALASQVAGLALDGLGARHIDRVVEQARNLDPDTARAAWDRVRKEERTVVLVGDASAWAASVQALGRGSVTVVPRD